MTKKEQPSTQNKQKPQRLSFLLRLWQTEEGRGSAWRASLEDPESGERIGFASLEQLFGFLMDRYEASDQAREVPAT